MVISSEVVIFAAMNCDKHIENYIYLLVGDRYMFWYYQYIEYVISNKYYIQVVEIKISLCM